MANAILVYPTIVTQGTITVESSKQFGQTNLSIFDMQGKEVLKKKIELNVNKNTIAINLTSGIYIMKFQANGLSTTRKIIVE